MAWYTVVKTIGTRKYLYLQMTYRLGGKVCTKNKYLGPIDGGHTSHTPTNLPTSPKEQVTGWIEPQTSERTDRSMHKAAPKPRKPRQPRRPPHVVDHIRRYNAIIKESGVIEKKAIRVQKRLDKRGLGGILTFDGIRDRLHLAAIKRELRKNNEAFDAILPEHIILRDAGHKVDYTRA